MGVARSGHERVDSSRGTPAGASAAHPCHTTRVAIATAIPTATVVIHFTIIARAAIRFRRISTILLPAARSIIESGRAKNASRFHGPRQRERGGH